MSQVTNWLLLVLTMLITCIITRISMSYYASRDDNLTDVKIRPLLVFVGSLMVTRLLLRVVDVAVNTIFQCFLEDTERNDGTSERPFFMSVELTKFLQKK